MNALFLGNKELLISLHAEACASLQQQIDKKKRFTAADGLLPGRLCLRADRADGAEQKAFFSYLSGRSLFQRRLYWADIEPLYELSVCRAESGSWQQQGQQAQLQLPAEEWRHFCTALEYFLAGPWGFFIELPSCGLVISFISHGSQEADSHRLLEDGRF